MIETQPSIKTFKSGPSVHFAVLLGGTWLLHPCLGRSDLWVIYLQCLATPPSGTAEPLGLSLVSNSTNEATAARILALRQRLKLPPPGLSSKSVNPGTHLNTATLLAHEHGGGLPGESLIMVCWEVRSSKNSKIDARLGSASKKWSASLYMEDIKADVVQVVNVEWTKQNLVALRNDATSFRWPVDRLLEPVPKKWKHFLKHAKTSPFICLELYIDYDAWKQAKESVENMNSVSDMTSSAVTQVTRKRSRTDSSKDLTSDKQKQIVPPFQQMFDSAVVSLRSEFSLSKRSGRAVVQKQSDITYRKITCITATSTGQPQLVDTGDIYRGHIFDTPFSSGSMKHAFDLILTTGEQYVAKHFFKLTAADSDLFESEVSVEANRVEVEGEITRLAIGTWFLNGFYRLCKSHGDVSVDTNIAFADAFLAIEVDRPSTASGVAQITDTEEGLTWLVERKRPTTVIKFSGTLVHRSHRRDLRSATISAFAHFVFGYSKGTLVVADLQGTPCLIRNNDGLILFDLMTHTKDEDSGIGDFGEKGIKSFIDDHQCTDLCRALTLESSYPLVMEEGDSSGKDSDEDLEIHD
ncbi:kinase-like domain-containing protein [Mycena leptocephala]|nr:kinase-like domain-containing protein [Mycena leptocephala]